MNLRPGDQCHLQPGIPSSRLPVRTTWSATSRSRRLVLLLASRSRAKARSLVTLWLAIRMPIAAPIWRLLDSASARFAERFSASSSAKLRRQASSWCAASLANSSPGSKVDCAVGVDAQDEDADRFPLSGDGQRSEHRQRRLGRAQRTRRHIAGLSQWCKVEHLVLTGSRHPGDRHGRISGDGERACRCVTDDPVRAGELQLVAVPQVTGSERERGPVASHDVQRGLARFRERVQVGPRHRAELVNSGQPTFPDHVCRYVVSGHEDP